MSEPAVQQGSAVAELCRLAELQEHAQTQYRTAQEAVGELAQTLRVELSSTDRHRIEGGIYHNGDRLYLWLSTECQTRNPSPYWKNTGKVCLSVPAAVNLRDFLLEHFPKD